VRPLRPPEPVANYDETGIELRVLSKLCTFWEAVTTSSRLQWPPPVARAGNAGPSRQGGHKFIEEIAERSLRWPAAY
jgi:hypothetical protein